MWKIAKLHWYQTFMVPYQGGWAKNKDINNGMFVSKQLPPDRPPTEKYGVWPAVYIPPFHYRNPRRAKPAALPDELRARRVAAAAAARAATAATWMRSKISSRCTATTSTSSNGIYFTELFAEDSTMEISQRGVYFGKKGVRRAIELFGPQNIEPDHLHNHIQMQPMINVSPDGKRAWVRSRALSMLGTYSGVGVWGDSVYENEMVKENGVWQFKIDHIFTTFFAPYDPGWATGARPRRSEREDSAGRTADAKSTRRSRRRMFRSIHYKNPVTGEPTAAPAEDRRHEAAAERSLTRVANRKKRHAARR